MTISLTLNARGGAVRLEPRKIVQLHALVANNDPAAEQRSCRLNQFSLYHHWWKPIKAALKKQLANQ